MGICGKGAEAGTSGDMAAPVAVLLERHRQGVGSALIREGLCAARQLGVQAVVVLGHSNYYPRFGFAPAAGWPSLKELGLSSAYGGWVVGGWFPAATVSFGK